MMCYNIFILLVCASSVVFADEEHGTNSLSYTDDTFTEEIAKKPHFVMFFAPWCGHCKRLSPTWDKLAAKYNEDLEKTPAVIARVDCTVQTALCSRQDVSGYPTLKFFKDGTDVRYSGKRDFEALDGFLLEQLSTAAKQPKEVSPSPAAVPTQGLYELGADNFEAHVAHGHHFVKFYAPWCGHCKRLAPDWEKLAQSYEDNKAVTIAKVDCTKHSSTCQGQAVKGYPTLLWFTDGMMIEKYQGARSLDDLKKFASDMVAKQKTPASFTEEKIPEVIPQEDVEELNSESFADAISKYTVFAKFYAPWCGHCKALAPTWKDLAKKFAGSSKIKIVKVDCTQHNDLCKSHKVNGYPTLILFHNGVQVAEHNSSRDLESLHQFVLNNVPHDEL